MSDERRSPLLGLFFGGSDSEVGRVIFRIEAQIDSDWYLCRATEPSSIFKKGAYTVFSIRSFAEMRLYDTNTELLAMLGNS